MNPRLFAGIALLFAASFVDADAQCNYLIRPSMYQYLTEDRPLDAADKANEVPVRLFGPVSAPGFRPATESHRSCPGERARFRYDLASNQLAAVVYEKRTQPAPERHLEFGEMKVPLAEWSPVDSLLVQVFDTTVIESIGPKTFVHSYREGLRSRLVESTRKEGEVDLLTNTDYRYDRLGRIYAVNITEDPDGLYGSAGTSLQAYKYGYRGNSMELDHLFYRDRLSPSEDGLYERCSVTVSTPTEAREDCNAGQEPSEGVVYTRIYRILIHQDTTRQYVGRESGKLDRGLGPRTVWTKDGLVHRAVARRLNNYFQFDRHYFEYDRFGNRTRMSTYEILPTRLKEVWEWEYEEGDIAPYEFVPATNPEEEPDAENLSISIFPNPALDRLTIEAVAGPVSGDVALIDVQGRVVRRLRMGPTNRIELDREGLAPGVYLVRILSQDQLISRPVVLR